MVAEPLHVEIHRGAGPPLLLVHGIMAGRALWGANVEALRAVATPVVVELYGHGRSPTPEDGARYEPRSYVSAFEEIRVGLGAERWYVAGHSLGAALTLRYALDHPERVIAHVFTNSASALADEAWRERVSANAGAEARRIEAAGREALAAHPINPARVTRIVPGVREALAADVPLLDPRGIAMTIRHTVPTSSVRDRIRLNRAPCLLIAGEREASFAEARDYARTAMPKLRVETVYAGHSPNAEAPDVYNALVVDFLRAVGR
jgi:pimeloyl-ACP methyl ester carboxylesterase